MTGQDGTDRTATVTGQVGRDYLYEYDPPQPYQLYANASAGTVLQVLTDPYSLAKSLSS